MKTAFITGITGQDGAYLTRFLLDKNYQVHGLIPRCEVDNKYRIEALVDHPNLKLHYGDMTDDSSLYRIISKIKPDEIYNLAAQSHVGISFDIPQQTQDVNGAGVLRLLEAVRQNSPESKVYQASSSELFGNNAFPQTEMTPMQPCSPYAIAKLYAFHTIKMYRETYNIHASNGILFNHESPFRGDDFVTKKVTKAVAAIKCGHKDPLTLGNLNSQRDWGHAQDYVRGMWQMLQQDQPDDYILATGKTYQVRTLVKQAFKAIGTEIMWQGQGLDEVGMNKETLEVLVKVDPSFYRPNELHTLCGDASKANNILDWYPTISFEEMIKEMVEFDIAALQNAKELKRAA